MSAALATEQIPPEEPFYIEDLRTRLTQKITNDYPNGPMRRDAHPKMHGLVRAEFTVEPNLPEILSVGLFKEPKTYQAWIRFSNQNATIQSDLFPDIRGMAIKVMGVPGKKIVPEMENAQTQDFILISTDVFVTANVKEFAELIKAMTTNSMALLRYGARHLRVMHNLAKSMRFAFNPLHIRYFSTTPYLFGSNNAVKYSVVPRVVGNTFLPELNKDLLRKAMIKQLANGEAIFDFMVQLQTDADQMPIEDPGKLWPESLSPFRKVATITIPKQDFDSSEQRELGENLSFSPWHALPEHRPLGGINRARRVVYDAISKFRHEFNKEPRKEPENWDIPSTK